MECENGVTRCIIDEPHCLYIQGYKMEGEKKVFLEVSWLN